MMEIGLAACQFKNGDTAFNMNQIEKALRTADAEIICFGETFLQGFDALKWNYEEDRLTAVSQDSAIMKHLCALTVQYQKALAVGYIEEAEEKLYSSYAVISQGKILYNYRRISKGWKEYTRTDAHYCQGSSVSTFSFHDHLFVTGLCGDVWEFPDSFQKNAILLWPIYVNFTLADWDLQKQDYIHQASMISEEALIVNSITAKPEAHGGAFHISHGIVKEELPFDQEDVLIVEVKG